MPTYRLQPTRAGRYWWAVIGATAIVLLLPALINLAVPDRDAALREIRLSGQGYSWEIPVHDPAGEIMSCRQSTAMITGHAWNCEGATVMSTVTAGGTDPDRTLWRMTRALSLTAPPENAPILREGDARLLIDHEMATLGLSLEGGGEHGEQTMVAVLAGHGAQTAPLADAVWRAYTDQPLPEVVLAEIHGLRDPLAGWNGVGALTMEGIAV